MASKGKKLKIKICKALSEDFLNKLKRIYNEKTGFLKKQLEELEKRKISIHKKIGSLMENISKQESVTNLLLLENILFNYENNSYQLEVRIYNLKERLLSFEEPQLFNPPSKPGASLKPKKKSAIAISLVLGFVLGVSAVFLQELWYRGERR